MISVFGYFRASIFSMIFFYENFGWLFRLMSDLVLSAFLGQMIEKQIALDMWIGYYLA